MNGVFCLALLCCSIVLSTYAQNANDDQELMEKRARSFAFAKRFDALGFNTYGFAKRSPYEDNLDDQMEKRARFAFAKRAMYGFAKRARFAFA